MPRSKDQVRKAHRKSVEQVEERITGAARSWYPPIFKRRKDGIGKEKKSREGSGLGRRVKNPSETHLLTLRRRRQIPLTMEGRKKKDRKEKREPDRDYRTFCTIRADGLEMLLHREKTTEMKRAIWSLWEKKKNRLTER